MAEVVGLGYLIAQARDLDAWRVFARDLLGLQASIDTPDRLQLRADEKAYRLDITRAEEDTVTAIGWEVKGPRELDELVAALEDKGYAVKRAGEEEVRARGVSGLAGFTDPDGQGVELFWGLKEHTQRFVSPTGARFLTGTGGLGHVFQFVRENDPYVKLYQEILGFKLSDYIDFGPGASGTFLHANPRHHSYAFAPVPHMPPGVGHLMLEVDDLDLVGRAWDRAENGAAPVVSTFGKHTNDHMLSFYVKTPSGFQIEYGYGGRLIDDTTWTPARYDAPSSWGHRHTRHWDPNEPDV